MGVVLAGALGWFLTSQPSAGGSRLSSREGVEPHDVDLLAESEGGGGPSGAPAMMRIDDEALLRLEAELALAPATVGRTDEERLAAAWEWVRANRPPERPYNDLEARMLALTQTALDGQEGSILWAMNAAMLEVEMVRALDANADGVVTDAEVETFAAENLNMLAMLDHPYIRSRLDANRDGQGPAGEVSVLHDLASMQNAIGGVAERAKIESWDVDLDGALTEAETLAGMEATLASVEIHEDGPIEVVSDASLIDQNEQEAVKQTPTERFGPSTLKAMEARREILAVQTLAQSLLDAMRVENMDKNLLGEQMMQVVPKAPEQMDFDENGDGQIDGIEGEAFAAAAQEYQKQIAEWSARQTARVMRMGFEHAMREHDLNGDGRLSDREWDMRLEDLLAAREKRLFLRSYDLDGNGRVDSTELMRFLDWHKAGSVRADANFDGVVNVLDLQAMMANYTKQ